MFALIVRSDAFWGFLGAVLFAAPKVSVCYYTCRENGTPWGRCIADFFVNLITGTISAAAFVGYFEWQFHFSDARAAAAVVGLLANPVVPEATKLLQRGAIRLMGGGDK